MRRGRYLDNYKGGKPSESPKTTLSPSGSDSASQVLEATALKLANAGFSVQRNITAPPYLLNILASYVGGPRGAYAPIPWSTIVAVSSMNVPSSDSAREFSSFVAKYVLDNRSSLGAFRMDMITIAVMISNNFSKETQDWVRQTHPAGSTIKDRSEFPVLMELDSRQVIYYMKTPFRAGLLYRQLRKQCDRWFGFQA